MKNICSYANSYQDEELVSLSEADALLLARLSYIHFENIISKIPFKIGDILKYSKEIKINFKDKKLVDTICHSKRYKDLLITHCENILDSEKEEQFTAITIMLPNKDIVISFRGTNKSIIGFKEDFNMSFETIASQYSAKEYVNNAKGYRHMYLVGHSKGGNLAMYAGMHLNWFKRMKLINIYNFDGPGFLTLDKKFNKIASKIVNFYPETCVVGRLLNNKPQYNVIKTNTFGIEAHNVYSWIIEDNSLVRGMFTNHSDEFAAACDNFILNVPEENRRIIVDYIYDLMLKGELKNLKELNLDKAKEIIAKIPKITKNEKENLINLMRSFLKALLPIKLNNDLVRKKNFANKEKLRYNQKDGDRK